jgi:hypothetical protein
MFFSERITCLHYEEIPLIGEMSAKLTKGLPFSPEKGGLLQSKKVGRVAPPDELFCIKLMCSISDAGGLAERLVESTPQSPLWR